MKVTARSYLEFYDAFDEKERPTNPAEWHWGDGLKVDLLHFKPFEREANRYKEHLVCINIGNLTEIHWSSDGGSKSYKLSADNVVVYPAYQEVAWGMRKHGKSIQILVKSEYLNEVAAEVYKVEPESIPKQIELRSRVNGDLFISRLGYELFEKSRATGSHARASMDTLTKALVAALVRDYSVGLRDDDRDTLSPSDSEIRKIISYLRGHFQESSLMAENVKKEYSMTRSDCDRFKNATGAGLKEYIIRLRISEAKKLLETPIGDLETISKRCGFNDMHYFCRQFRVYEGCAPGEYRKAIFASPSKKSNQF